MLMIVRAVEPGQRDSDASLDPATTPSFVLHEGHAETDAYNYQRDSTRHYFAPWRTLGRLHIARGYVKLKLCWALDGAKGILLWGNCVSNA